MTVFAVEYVYAAESSEARDATRPAHREWTADFPRRESCSPADPTGTAQVPCSFSRLRTKQALNEILKQDPFAAAGAIAGIRTMVWAPVTGLLAGHTA